MLWFSHVLLFTASFATVIHLPENSANLILLTPSPTIIIAAPVLNLSAATVPSSRALSGAGNVPATNVVPCFNDTVYAAVLRTTARYPRAVFVEADITPANGPTTDPNELTDVRLIFSYHVGRYRSIYINMEAWGQWSEPWPTENVPHPSSGPLPLSLGMDIAEADNLLKAAGYTQEYDFVDVRWPTRYRLDRQQVFYFFHMEGAGPAVAAVGARDGSVTPSIEDAERKAASGTGRG